MDKAGNNIAAKMAIMAITTSNSMSVNPLLIEFEGVFFIKKSYNAVEIYSSDEASATFD